jgi:hypothetical protein
MLKFYTNTKEITPENRRHVFPMLFDWFYLESAVAKQCFQFVETIESADICILPIDYGFYLSQNRSNDVDEFVSSAKVLGKMVWLYSGGDFGITLSKEVVTFRFGGFHSKMNRSNFIMPSFVNDPYSSILENKWQPQTKQEQPTIGFVGNADGSFSKYAKELLIYGKQSLRRIFKKEHSDWQSFFPSSIIRFKLLEKMRYSDIIVANFMYRNKYRAGAKSDQQKKQTTLEFYQNMEMNLYTFCMRGSGNFSVRFYETLMMGRIPLLIDTDVRLPFHNEINWDEHCVLASSQNYIEKLYNFHHEKTNEELIEIQKKNRKLALELFNRQQYFLEIYKINRIN